MNFLHSLLRFNFIARDGSDESRDELYKECVTALQGGFLLNGGDFNAIRKALTKAFENADKKLLNW